MHSIKLSVAIKVGSELVAKECTQNYFTFCAEQGHVYADKLGMAYVGQLGEVGVQKVSDEAGFVGGDVLAANTTRRLLNLWPNLGKSVGYIPALLRAVKAKLPGEDYSETTLAQFLSDTHDRKLLNTDEVIALLETAGL